MVRPPMRPAMGMVLWKVSWLAERFFMGSCFVFLFFFSFVELLVRENHDE